jgi:hypothetical protein
MNSKKKIQLVLDEQAQATLENLVTATRSESMAHVLRDALGVYSSLFDLLQSSGPTAQLAIVDRARQELQELNIPSLQGKSVVAGPKSALAQATLVPAHSHT